MSERLSVMMERAGDPALARLFERAELSQALEAKSDRELSQLIELALAEGVVESEAIAALLEAASYRLFRAAGGATPSATEPHAFEPFCGTTDMCWVCGDLADHQRHQSKAEGGATETRPSLARGVTSCETPSASDEWNSHACVGWSKRARNTARCCNRAGEYNGFGSDGPTTFTCPKSCLCHD